MAAPNEFYAMQPSFTGGEISGDVASRVDLDKYQLALLQAENAGIRPYGGVHKRSGLIYCGETKYSDKKALLVRFGFSVEVSYMLEIGDKYIRVWRDGRYLGIEIATPFEQADLTDLRFVQSIDVLYITSGSYPVKKLMRYSETDWRLADIDWILPPYNEINSDEANTITPSAISGTITLTAVKDTFNAVMVGDWMNIQQRITGKTISATAASTTVTTAPIMVGDTWKVITHGTWTGSAVIEISTDNGATWLQERKYTSNNDYNPTESGQVEEYSLMRLVITTSSGSCTADLSAYPYTHNGHIKITGVTNARTATAEVIKALGSISATADWKWGAWSKANGYPYCTTFFQDRLVFGGSDKNPQRVWMSRSGDYENFGVEKESGSVTDDSSISADLLSLRSYKINHIDAGNDLIILTEGNEWTISGSETVTPSSITPRNQQNYGSSDCLPIRVGNRVIYVQRRGSIVRDMGYAYDTDSYGGADLTLLAKHLIKGKEILYSAFAQEPDSTIYFVRDDGVLLCLTYIMEQKVYAWSHIVTDGIIEAVMTGQQGNNDTVYVIVQRTINGTIKRYIEKFDIDRDSSAQQDYIMMDSAKIYNETTPINEIAGLQHLEGKEVWVMADGYLHGKMTVTGGVIYLPAGTKASKITVGLPYTMMLEQPNFDTTLKDSGTVQGREKTVNNVILRLTNSYGGTIGPDPSVMNDIIYESGRMELGEDVLYTGDIKVTMAAGGFNKEGRVYIKHDTPYPFNLSAIIRAVTFGGTAL